MLHVVHGQHQRAGVGEVEQGVAQRVHPPRADRVGRPRRLGLGRLREQTGHLGVDLGSERGALDQLPHDRQGHVALHR